MRFVCDAPDRTTWFQIETEAEAALESDLMQHAVELPQPANSVRDCLSAA